MNNWQLNSRLNNTCIQYKTLARFYFIHKIYLSALAQMHGSDNLAFLLDVSPCIALYALRGLIICVFAVL